MPLLPPTEKQPQKQEQPQVHSTSVAAATSAQDDISVGALRDNR